MNAGPKFNLSHSEVSALVAVSNQVAVGVDVESIGEVPEAVSIAEKFFSQPDAETLSKFEASARSNCFLRLWTRKEAYLKATGDGISMGLNRFTVGLKRSMIYDSENKPWGLINLTCSPDCIAALCAPGHYVYRQRALPE
jgi:4'-phosphopantetheinyl transferase